jgi:hypothetical protein
MKTPWIIPPPLSKFNAYINCDMGSLNFLNYSSINMAMQISRPLGFMVDYRLIAMFPNRKPTI